MSADTSSDAILNKFTSTVFQCETTQDVRYIRCDFKRCSKHVLNRGTSKHPIDYWMLNTEKNVKILEKHVSDEIYDFISSLESDEDELNVSVNCPWSKDKYELNSHMVENNSHLQDYDKLLVVFNLRDPQSSFGKWIDLFLSTVKNEDNIEVNYKCITLSFSSRKELLKQISKLRSITSKNNALQIMIVLSCHSSSQGQVFSCTPASITRLYHFEEFCSVHDFVCACQYVLKNKLKWIHISSCFAMKLNISHKKWPVDYTWYKKKLRCILSGSAKEVYETGSQTADLFMLLNTMLVQNDIQSEFHNIFTDASYNLFPDLILEMGLTVINPFTVSAMMENPEKDDTVTKPQVVNSTIHLVIIYSEDDYTGTLKEALMCNLKNRNSSDVKSNITLINISCDDNPIAQLMNGFNDLISISKKIFFLVLGRFMEPKQFTQAISLCQQRSIFNVYGIHMNRLKEGDVSYLESNCVNLNLTITGFVEKPGISGKYISPVLLYIVHLSLGENGNVVTGSASSSSWLLEDVYKEVLHVLPGLCERSNITLISKLPSNINCKINSLQNDQISPSELSNLSDDQCGGMELDAGDVTGKTFSSQGECGDVVEPVQNDGSLKSSDKCKSLDDQSCEKESRTGEYVGGTNIVSCRGGDVSHSCESSSSYLSNSSNSSDDKGNMKQSSTGNTSKQGSEAENDLAKSTSSEKSAFDIFSDSLSHNANHQEKTTKDQENDTTNYLKSKPSSENESNIEQGIHESTSTSMQESACTEKHASSTDKRNATSLVNVDMLEDSNEDLNDVSQGDNDVIVLNKNSNKMSMRVRSIKLFPCDDCHKNYKSLRLLRRHKCDHKHKCDKCNMIFERKYLFIKHRERCKDSPPDNASHQEKTREAQENDTVADISENYLEPKASNEEKSNNASSNEGDEIYPCDACHRIYMSKCMLTKHKKQHKDYIHKCRRCNMLFGRKHLATKHELKCSGRLPQNVCDNEKNVEDQGNDTVTDISENCNTASSNENESNVEQSMSTSMQKIEHKCDLCEKVFWGRRSLIGHRNKAHVPLRKKVCDKWKNVEISESSKTEPPNKNEGTSMSIQKTESTESDVSSTDTQSDAPGLLNVDIHGDVNDINMKKADVSEIDDVRVVLDKYSNMEVQSEKMLQCDKCSESFSSLELLAKHEDNHKAKHKCELCEKVYTRRAVLNRHRKRVHESLSQKTTESQEEDTVADISDNNQPESSVVLNKNSNMDNSMGVQSDKIFQCGKCTQSFISLQLWAKHQKVHAKHTCDICNKLYSTNRSLNHHRKTIHGSLSHNASHQQKTTESQEHDTVAENYKPEPSDNDGSNVEQSINESLSTSMHKPVCTEKQASSSTGNQDGLVNATTIEGGNEVHIKEEDLHGEIAQVGNEPITLNKNSNMDNSMGVQSEKIFQCGKCSKSFRSSLLWEKHQKTHAEHACEMCDKIYSSRKSLKRHRRSIHVSPSESAGHHQNMTESQEHNTVADISEKYKPEPSNKNGSNSEQSIIESTSASMQKPECTEKHVEISQVGNDCIASSKTSDKDNPMGVEGSNRFQCDICPRMLKSHMLFIKHQNNHKTYKHRCDVCNKIFEKPYRLINHRKKCNGSTSLDANHHAEATETHENDTVANISGNNKPEPSDKSCSNSEQSILESTSASLEKPVSIEKHDSFTDKPDGATGSINVDRKEVHTKEEDLNEDTLEADDELIVLDKNSMGIQKDKIFRCGKCPRSFRSLKLLAKHQKNHKVVKHKCDLCKKIFSRKELLISHRRRAHESRSKKACHDGKTTESQGNIPVTCHKPEPSNENRSNSEQSVLEDTPTPMQKPVHTEERVSSTDKRNKTSELVNTAHVDNESTVLNKISNMDNSMGEFPCDICPRIYKSSKAFAKHQYNHKIYKYKCDVCNKIFVRMPLLINHRKKCNGDSQGSSIEAGITPGDSQGSSIETDIAPGDSQGSSVEADIAPGNSQGSSVAADIATGDSQGSSTEDDIDFQISSPHINDFRNASLNASQSDVRNENINQVNFKISIYKAASKNSVKYSCTVGKNTDKHKCTIKYRHTRKDRHNSNKRIDIAVKETSDDYYTRKNSDKRLTRRSERKFDHNVKYNDKFSKHVKKAVNKKSETFTATSSNSVDKHANETQLNHTDKYNDKFTMHIDGVVDKNPGTFPSSEYKDVDKQLVNKCHPSTVSKDIDEHAQQTERQLDNTTKYNPVENVNASKYSTNVDKNVFDIFAKESKDVPLMANVDEVLVYHYNLELDVQFEEKCIEGNILLFIKPTNEQVALKEFQMCLDCTLIDIESVHEISLPDDFEIHFHMKSCCCKKNNQSSHGDSVNNSCTSCYLLQNYKNYLSTGLKYQTLEYAVYGWCIRIWKEGTKEWPKCVYIKYRTKPVGPSLMWCEDDAGNPCAFTPGAYINNRSMMPCQEPPVAMSTWQASIQVPEGFIVLSSGDKVECKSLVLQNEATNKFYFQMSLPLPSSTLAFAFGKFVRSSKVIPVLCSPNTNVVNVSLYASSSKIKSFENEYLELTAKYVKSACAILGKYPFTRVDLVVMPRSFACLGLESPNLTFLSQSILCGDQSMSTRIAHEISHAWFGLLVGAEDWTEEWLSEGFATYIEDRILAHGQEMTEEQFSEYSYLMQILRYKTLKAEIAVTEDDNLKRLRPIRSGNCKSVVEAVNDSILEDDSAPPPVHIMIPNAAVSSKKWSQVHYLKGYFLLLRMAKMVGLESFDAFLRYYLNVYAGKLVTSEMFFNLYLEYYSLPTSITEEIKSQWMESTTVPLFPEENTISNTLVSLVEVETKFWKSSNSSNKRCKKSGYKRKHDTFKTRPILNSNQLVLLLENLLEVDEIVSQTLTQMNHVYNLGTRNSEVKHRWCELIIKHLYFVRYDHVERFLIEDQGMGIYLFAELVITSNPRQLALATHAFETIKNEMDRSTFTTVSEILYGEA